MVLPSGFFCPLPRSLPRSSPVVHALVFVLAPAADLPGDQVSWDQLVQAQKKGLRSGVALRLCSAPDTCSENLLSAVDLGLLKASGELPSTASQWYCDCLVPHFDVHSLWMGVYAISGTAREGEPSPSGEPFAITSGQCLDRFPLKDAGNETCWFYPTDSGRYLRWENQRQIETLPGLLADRPVQDEPIAYSREALHVLWSLMADDRYLTCVGLTLGGKRIEWPLQLAKPEPFATWTAFAVNDQDDEGFTELASTTVFSPDQPASP